MDRTFLDEVQLALSGKLHIGEMLRITNCPKLFIEAGLGDYPLLYTQKHLHNALAPKDDFYPHFHGLSLSKVLSFPNLFHHEIVLLADNPSNDQSMLVVFNTLDVDSDALFIEENKHMSTTWGGILYIPESKKGISLKISVQTVE